MKRILRWPVRAAASAVIPTLAGLLAISGCATLPRRPAPASDPSVAGWDALADGRRVDAARLFAARLAVAPGDPVALLGRATIAYERGESLAALADDVAALTVARLGSGCGVGLRWRRWRPAACAICGARSGRPTGRGSPRPCARSSWPARPRSPGWPASSWPGSATRSPARPTMPRRWRGRRARTAARARRSRSARWDRSRTSTSIARRAPRRARPGPGGRSRRRAVTSTSRCRRTGAPMRASCARRSRCPRATTEIVVEFSDEARLEIDGVAAVGPRIGAPL